MSGPAPQVLLKRDSEAVAVNGSDAAAGGPKSSRTRAPLEGMKLTLRRLPPGITETEVLDILGHEWRVGSGRVDWKSFDAGSGR